MELPRPGRPRAPYEALLFFGFSGVSVLLTMAPLWVSSYVLQPRAPDVSLTVENIADFISAYILGNLLQMAFRFWAFRSRRSLTADSRRPSRTRTSQPTSRHCDRGSAGRGPPRT